MKQSLIKPNVFRFLQDATNAQRAFYSLGYLQMLPHLGGDSYDNNKRRNLLN